MIGPRLANASHAAPRTALEAAQLLAQLGEHSHLHSEHQSTCVSDDCEPTPTVLHGIGALAPFKPGGILPALHGPGLL